MKKTLEQSAAMTRGEAQAKNAQARVTVAQTATARVTPARLQEALMWSEILGAPKCRKRHATRARYAGK